MSDKLLRTFFLLSLAIFLLFCVVGTNGSPSTIFGFKTRNSVVVSATTSFHANGMKIKSDYRWVRKIGKETMIAISGPPQLCESIFDQVALYYNYNELMYRSNQDLSNENPATSTKMIAKLCRNMVCKYRNGIQKGKIKLGILVGGIARIANKKSHNSDKNQLITRPVLYWIDQDANLKSLSYAGFGEMIEFVFLLSLLDQQNEEWKKKNGQGLEGIERMEIAQEVIQNCWAVIQKRSSQELLSFLTESISV
jgi:20S proteasome alpha/beta subunit